MQLQFLGATKTVTGSKYLITVEHKNILIDCGLFQGYKELRLRNWNKLPIDAKKIDAVILTHAHIDHSGYIPLLVKQGFRGKIYCSEATRDLCAILLPDSGYLQEEEAHFANLKGYSKHHPALPLYTKEDAEESLKYFHPILFGTPIKIADETSFSLHYAGHILGASYVLFNHSNTKILFSGDLGRPHDPVMRASAQPQACDYLVVESTYGDRKHEETMPEDQFAEIINKTYKRHGSILIPAFAVGRAQNILYYLHKLKSENRIPDMPIYVDSPMATDATELYCLHHHQHRLSKNLIHDVCRIAKYIHTAEESMKLDRSKKPCIIISASGMATGGRVLHHLEHMLPDEKNAIIFAGYQAGGTRGDRIVKGEQEVKMHGEMIPVNAEIFQMNNMSAHADADEILEWLQHMPEAPRKVFVTHGEEISAKSFAEKIHDTFGWDCEVPEYLEKVSL